MRLSFLTLQRGNAGRDAPRHKSTEHSTLKIGRGASRTAFPRGAWGTIIQRISNPGRDPPAPASLHHAQSGECYRAGQERRFPVGSWPRHAVSA
ncbi:hypothetical protein B5U27_00705 [Pseudomonas amygdali pv. lachrymans]|nr:hypothetical protein B5U27_00705 [Pseudomonas amygdali pv. lachrymans]